MLGLSCNLLLFQGAIKHLASSLSLMIRCNLLLFQSAIKPLSLNRIQPISCNLLLFQSAAKQELYTVRTPEVVTYCYFKVLLNLHRLLLVVHSCNLLLFQSAIKLDIFIFSVLIYQVSVLVYQGT